MTDRGDCSGVRFGTSAWPDAISCDLSISPYIHISSPPKLFWISFEILVCVPLPFPSLNSICLDWWKGCKVRTSKVLDPGNMECTYGTFSRSPHPDFPQPGDEAPRRHICPWHACESVCVCVCAVSGCVSGLLIQTLGGEFSGMWTDWWGQGEVSS